LETGFYNYNSGDRLAWQNGGNEFIRLPLPGEQENSNN
jgi:hypothetical protein